MSRLSSKASICHVWSGSWRLPKYNLVISRRLSERLLDHLAHFGSLPGWGWGSKICRLGSENLVPFWKETLGRQGRVRGMDYMKRARSWSWWYMSWRNGGFGKG